MEEPLIAGVVMKSEESLESLLGLRGKVSLVVGASGDIGSSVTEMLLRAGSLVIAVDREPPRRPLSSAWCDSGSTFIPCDVAKPDQVGELLTQAGRRFGRLDVLVHSAGITRDAVLWKMTHEAWSEVLRVNLDSAFYLLKAASPLMRKTGGGSIVLVSSITGQKGKFGQINYTASKAGMIGLGKTAALELGRFGIRVNSVAPAWIETRMTAGVPESVRESELAATPLGRLGAPEDVARVVLFLASDLARHVNGQVIRVDGGQVMA